MKIAAITDDGITISQHFGRAPLYVVVTLEEGKIVSKETRPKAGHHTFAESHHDLAPGERRLGPLEFRVDVAADGAVATVDAVLRNASERELYLESVIFGFRWTRHGVESLRFLRHGWQSWSFTGARVLDDRGEPEFPSGPWLRGMHHAVGAPPPDREGWHESDLVSAVGAAPSGPTCLVGVLETVTNLHGDLHGAIDRQPPLSDKLGERPAFDIGHRDVRAVLVLSDLVHGDDMGMAQAC